LQLRIGLSKRPGSPKVGNTVDVRGEGEIQRSWGGVWKDGVWVRRHSPGKVLNLKFLNMRVLLYFGKSKIVGIM